MPAPIPVLYEGFVCSDTKPSPIEYKILIHDSSLVGEPTPRPMELQGEGFLLRYEGDEDDMLAKIIPSSLKLYFVVKNELDQEFIEELAMFQEERFYISITAKVVGTFIENEFWRGIVAQDLIQYEDTRDCPPYQVEINAIDGLTRLKNFSGDIILSDSSNPNISSDINNYFIQLLAKATGSLLYDQNEEFFQHNVKWFDQTMQPQKNGQDPIDSLRFTSLRKERTLYDPDQDFNKYYTWWDVLERLLKSYGSRLIHTRGHFYMLQVERYDIGKVQTNTFNVYARSYHISSNVPNMLFQEGVIAYNRVENIRLPYQLDLTTTGNRYNLLPMYGNIRLLYDTPGTNYILNPITRDWRFDALCSAYVIEANDGVAYSYDFQTGGTGAWTIEIAYYIELTIIDQPVTKYYLNQQWKWDTDPNSVYRVTRTGYTTGNGKVNLNSNGSFPPVPGNCTMCARVFPTIKKGTVNNPPPTQTLTIVAKGAVNNLVYLWDLPAYANSSLQYSLENPIFKDNNDNVLVPFVDVWTGSYWGKHVGWVRNTPTAGPGLPYPEFIGKSMVALYNDISRRKYYGDIWASWDPVQSIPYDGKVYIVNSAELKPSTGYWNVTMLEIRDNTDSIGWPIVRNRIFGRSGKTSTEIESEVADEYVRNKGEFLEGSFYEANDLVTYKNLLAIALAPTEETPKLSTLTGELKSPAGILPNQNTYTQVVYASNIYTFTKEGVINSVGLYVPLVQLPETRYRLFIQDEIAGTNKYVFVEGLIANQWVYFPIEQMIVLPGQVLKIKLEAVNISLQQETAFDLTYEGVDDSAPPVLGGWNADSKQSLLRLSTTSLNSGPVFTILSQVQGGSTISFQTGGAIRTYAILEAGSFFTHYFTFKCALISESGEFSIGEVTQTLLTLIEPDDIAVSFGPEYWFFNPEAFANVQGELNGAASLNAYGAGIAFQEGKPGSSTWFVTQINATAVQSLDVTRAYMLADAELNGYLSSTDSVGIVPTATQVVVANDNKKIWTPIKHYSKPVEQEFNIPSGNVFGQVVVSVADAQANERIYVEIYAANNDGVAVSANNGLPIGIEGVSPIVYMQSQLLNLSANSITNVEVKGTAPASVQLGLGGRLIYRYAFEKVGTQGANKQFTWYFGAAQESYVQIRVPVNAEDVAYKNTSSNLPAINVQQAIDYLALFNIGVADARYARRYNTAYGNLASGSYVVDNSWDGRLYVTNNRVYTLTAAAGLAPGTTFSFLSTASVASGNLTSIGFTQTSFPEGPILLPSVGYWAECIWYGSFWAIKTNII